MIGLTAAQFLLLLGLVLHEPTSLVRSLGIACICFGGPTVKAWAPA
jgi:hypothetical protein